MGWGVSYTYSIEFDDEQEASEPGARSIAMSLFGKSPGTEQFGFLIFKSCLNTACWLSFGLVLKGIALKISNHLELYVSRNIRNRKTLEQEGDKTLPEAQRTQKLSPYT